MNHPAEHPHLVPVPDHLCGHTRHLAGKEFICIREPHDTPPTQTNRHHYVRRYPDTNH